MRRRAGLLLMIIGAVLMIGALSLFAYNNWEDEQAGEASEQALAAVIEYIEEASESGDASSVADPYSSEMTAIEIDGAYYIGYIYIPAISIELPVLEWYSEEGLKSAPARYTGSTRTGDLVLCGHSYKRHFRYIRTLSEGDDVYFTDMDGVVWHYQVAGVEVVQPTDIDSMIESGFDLTLFTCTADLSARYAVRCNLAE